MEVVFSRDSLHRRYSGLLHITTGESCGSVLNYYRKELSPGKPLKMELCIDMIRGVELTQYSPNGQVAGRARLGETKIVFNCISTKCLTFVSAEGKRTGRMFVNVSFVPLGAIQVIQSAWKASEISKKQLEFSESSSEDDSDYNDGGFETSKYNISDTNAYGLSSAEDRLDELKTSKRLVHAALYPSKTPSKRTIRKTSRVHEKTLSPRVEKPVPRLRSKTNRSGQSTFLERLDRHVETVRGKVEYRNGLETYKANLSKLQCPRCRTEQTYDEVLKRKKHCSGCGVKYRHKLRWNDVRAGFMRRNPMTKQRKNTAARKPVQPSSPVWKDVRHDFLLRVEKANKQKVPAIEADSSSRDALPNPLNYTMYVKGCKPSSMPDHVERLLNLPQESSSDETPHDTDFIQARDKVLARLQRQRLI